MGARPSIICIEFTVMSDSSVELPLLIGPVLRLPELTLKPSSSSSSLRVGALQELTRATMRTLAPGARAYAVTGVEHRKKAGSGVGYVVAKVQFKGYGAADVFIKQSAAYFGREKRKGGQVNGMTVESNYNKGNKVLFNNVAPTEVVKRRFANSIIQAGVKGIVDALPSVPALPSLPSALPSLPSLPSALPSALPLVAPRAKNFDTIKENEGFTFGE
jgi:hypothetical protein